MARATPIAVRQCIVEQYKAGKSVIELSRTHHVSRGSIYSFIRREQQDGKKGLLPRYHNCGTARPGAQELVYRAVRCFRTWHPGWGAEKIRAELVRLRPDLHVPHYRTINRWLHWNGQLETPLRSQPPPSPVRQSSALHQGWQIDAKEELRLADGSRNCWLNITDEHSGTVISPAVFPH